jgi:hypothetical protein
MIVDGKEMDNLMKQGLSESDKEIEQIIMGKNFSNGALLVPVTTTVVTTTGNFGIVFPLVNCEGAAHATLPDLMCTGTKQFLTHNVTRLRFTSKFLVPL